MTGSGLQVGFDAVALPDPADGGFLEHGNVVSGFGGVGCFLHGGVTLHSLWF